jgi:hypothetical protein
MCPVSTSYFSDGLGTTFALWDSDADALLDIVLICLLICMIEYVSLMLSPVFDLI